VVAFCRIDDREIRLREPIMAPDACDHSGPDAAASGRRVPGPQARGLRADQLHRSFDELGIGEFAQRFRRERLCTVPATEIALKHVGRPLPNAAAARRLRGDQGLVTLESPWRMPSATSSRARWPRQRRRGPTEAFLRAREMKRSCAMLKQTEGSRAVAEAVALCRPEVICAYPITPQTHIVEALGELVKTARLPCEFINVESEFAAMSVAIGASAAGARAYTATASQGMLFMAEAVYNASGLGLPIVMTVANRAIGAPINIWNDHTTAMSQRDCGWIQLFAETNQEALDLHIQAFKLAEELSMPVMVCMDGFILTHAYERVDMPTQAQVDAFLPPYEPRQVLDPDDPVTIGAMVGPRGLHGGALPGSRQADAGAGAIPQLAAEFKANLRPRLGGLLHPYRCEDARRSSWRWARCSARSRTRSTNCAPRASASACSASCFVPAVPAGGGARRRWPCAKRVVVLEKSFSVGHRRHRRPPTCAWRSRACAANGYTVVAGLGGRAITRQALHRMLARCDRRHAWSR
jgi:pyruvate ferredoxin oxidoreductase alpha subunit